MRNLSTLQVHLSFEKSWIVTNCWYPHSELCSKILWEVLVIFDVLGKYIMRKFKKISNFED